MEVYSYYNPSAFYLCSLTLTNKEKQHKQWIVPNLLFLKCPLPVPYLPFIKHLLYVPGKYAIGLEHE